MPTFMSCVGLVCDLGKCRVGCDVGHIMGVLGSQNEIIAPITGGRGEEGGRPGAGGRPTDRSQPLRGWRGFLSRFEAASEH